MTDTNIFPDVHPLNFALKYDPPTILLQYYLGNKPTEEYVHQVKLLIKEGATASIITEELQREESVYFNPNIVSKKQVLNCFILILL